jgi:hypothetical protein
LKPFTYRYIISKISHSRKFLLGIFLLKLFPVCAHGIPQAYYSFITCPVMSKWSYLYGI